MKYHIITLGCQMNWADSERIGAILEGKGYKQASKIEDADLVVVNMCSVRQSAVDRVMGLKEKLKNKKTIITGCVLKKDRLKLEKQFGEIVDIKEYIKKNKKNYSKNIIAYVPIMTGCNNFCSYCVVPYTRGREISRPAEEIICEVKNLVKNEAKEIWLLGQNVNSYKYNFPELLKTINAIPGKFLIRFTSPHPKDFSDELIEAMAKCEKFGEYLNLPVQAGDNQILKKMNRTYTVSHYEKLVKKIREKIPGISLSTDVIVGFPGETKKQFENTAKLFRKIKYDMAYINKYSPRAGTMAEKMKDNILPKEKIRRAKVLNEILKQTALENNKKYIGETIEILTTATDTGKTRTNKTIKINCHIPVGKFTNVKITNALIWGLRGDLI
jgi:tRNA-2-methylthio-N6-dimethylallyladenosine synthase